MGTKPKGNHDGYEVSAGGSEDEVGALSVIRNQGEAYNHGERTFWRYG
jgi:hypothetical protein